MAVLTRKKDELMFEVSTTIGTPATFNLPLIDREISAFDITAVWIASEANPRGGSIRVKCTGHWTSASTAALLGTVFQEATQSTGAPTVGVTASGVNLVVTCTNSDVTANWVIYVTPRRITI